MGADALSKVFLTELQNMPQELQDNFAPFMEDELAKIDAGDGTEIDAWIKDQGTVWGLMKNATDEQMQGRAGLARERAMHRLAKHALRQGDEKTLEEDSVIFPNAVRQQREQGMYRAP